MANIFGQKELINTIQVKTEKDDEKKPVSIEKSNNGIVTINSGSMTDYFKHKLNYNKNFSCSVDKQGIDSGNEDEQYAGFGFASKTEKILSNEASTNFDKKNNYAFDNPCLGLNSPTEVILSDTDNICKKSAKKRKKEHENDNLHTTTVDKHNVLKKLKTEIINGDYKDGLTNPALNLDINPEEECNGKEFEVSRAQFGLENCGLDLTDEKSNKKCVTFNDHVTLYEYNVDSTKKRKGKATLDKFEVENKKHKKKQKQENITTPGSNGFINEALDIETICKEINDNQLNEHKSKKIKRRKTCKISNLETIQESPEGEKEIIEIKVESEDILDTSIQNGKKTDIVDKKLKKKKTKVENIVVDTNEELDFETKEVIKDKKIKRHKSKEEEIVNSKKNKKERKKNKENYKIEKCAIQIELNNDKQNNEILVKTNLKQHQNHSIMDENKNTTEIEVMPVIEIKNEKEEVASLENKQKKKKKKSIHDEDCFKDECDTKKEISDKENIGKEQDSKKLEKENKKCKKSKEKNVSDIDNSIDSNLEIENANTITQKKVENVESTHISLKKSSIVNSIENIMHSPWNAKARMSKKMLTLFQNNELLDFPGSNIRDIKGYGVDIEC